MKLGFVSSILDGWSFEEMIDTAAAQGFECVEIACWPSAGKTERRYAGVCHIDTETLDDQKAEYILNYCKERKIEISSLAFYPNTMDPDEQKREENIRHLKSVIDASAKLNVNMVTTFIGRDQTKSVEENLKLVEKIWPPILEYAKERKVKIAIENCPMLFGEDQWPGGQNLMTSPENWDKIFEILDSEYLGINFDPSHFVWQMMDYIHPIYEYKDKIFHVQRESQEWGNKLEISTVGDLNDKITKGGIQDILLIQEALQESKISEIASKIASAGNKKFVMIAGPSSSGKTTFSHRLSIQLAAHGM